MSSRISWATICRASCPPRVRSAFDHHLQLCPNCQKYLAGYEETVKLGKRAFDHDDAAVPADVPEELVKAILDARNRH